MGADLPSRDELLDNQLAIADLAVRAAAATPVKGWNAGQVCAHVLMNNGLFIEAARCVLSGGPHVYDNETAVDDVSTAALAAGAGSTGILAEWLRQSATAYVDLLTTLPQSERYTYDFEGNSQSLDHILLSNALRIRPFAYDVVHVNSEFATQVSDHDPQVVRLSFGPVQISLPLVRR